MENLNNSVGGFFKNIQWTVRKVTIIALSIVALIVCIKYSGDMYEEVNADEIVVIQHPISGKLDVYTSAGTYFQYLGKPTHYKKRKTVFFSSRKTEGDTTDTSIKVRFNDGGHAQINISASIGLPLDEESVIKFHTQWGSQESIERDLVSTVLQKSVYMTGTLMSSKESSAEKRNDLIFYVDDQSTNGVYKTIQKEVETTDPFTKEKKVATIVEIQRDKNGKALTQEISPIKEYHLKLSNFSINSIDYSKDVEQQIKDQQALTMKIQTAMTNSKLAEQNAITTEQTGKAEATKAKWAQEVLKATAVTQAQQQKEVAELDAKTALARAMVTRTDADAQAYANAKLVSAGLSPVDRAEYEMKTKIGVAEAIAKINLPSTYMAGNSGGGNNSMLEAILGTRLLEGMNTPTKK